MSTGSSPDVREATYRYNVVLLLALAVVVFEITAPDEPWSRAVALGLESCALLVAMATSRAPSAVRRTRATVVSVAAVLLVIAVATETLSYPLGAVLIALLAAAIPLVLSRGLLRLIRTRGVTLPAVAGALAIYLNLGLLFAAVVGFVAHVDDASYFAHGTDGSWGERVYFSFTTMTTTGLGDYTAATAAGRALTVVEMLFGQIYLVTVISLLVGALAGRRR